MDSVRLAALRNRAARPSQGNAARACGPRSIHVQLFSAVSAPSPRQRQLHSLTALPPPPLAWPSGTHRHPASSAAPARCTDVTCSAMQGAQGGTPEPQQQFVQEQQQQEQRQPAGSSGSAAAGGWQGALQRSDSRILRACRASAGFFASVGAYIAADVRRFLLGLLETAHELPPLLGQLRYPSPRLLAKRTVQVLAVVALLLGYVVAVDALCSQIPRWIQHTQAHPDWLHKAAGGLLAAARQRLAGGT